MVRELLSVAAVLLAAPSAALAQSVSLPQIDVIATSPLTGTGIDRDKVPALVQTLSADDIQRTYSPSLTDTLFQRIPGVSTNDVQGNGFVQDLRYRGFAASPLAGTPQGLAVYLGGTRINEAFGDTVNWDLIPTNAIDRVDLWTNNPVFGLNALGGAVNIQMKNGFTWQGFEAEAQGGSFGRRQGALQYGVQKGDVAFYVAAQAAHDDGWRFQSPSDIARVFADLGWKGDRSEVHLTALGASNAFGVVGPTPVELITLNEKSIFTWPQTTDNQVGMLTLNGKHAFTDELSVQTNSYVRSLPPAPRRRQRRRHRALQQRFVVSQPAVPGGRRLPAPQPGHHGVPRPVRHPQSVQRADSVPAGQWQHLCAGPLRDGRSHLDRVADLRVLGAD